jgi:8-oxo-dGTP diphosphatase
MVSDHSIIKSCDGGEIGNDLPPLPYLKTITVPAVLLIDTDNRILLAQRPVGKSMAGLWEFPGGKLKDGETPEYALIRELNEELGIMTGVDCLQPVVFASHSYDDFHLLMPIFACRTWQGTPQPMEGQALKWVHKQDLSNYAMPPADIPLIPLIHQLL